MDATVPGIEIADDADALCVGRPDGELHATNAFNFADVRAERIVELVMRAFADQVQLEFGEHGRKGVRVDHFAGAAVVPAEAQAVVAGLGPLRDIGGQPGLEDAAGFDAVGGDLVPEDEHGDVGGVRLHDPDDVPATAVAVDRVRAQVAEWVAMLRAQEKLRVGGRRDYLGRLLMLFILHRTQITPPLDSVRTHTSA